MDKCFSYIRFSTKQQLKGDSKDRQFAIATKYAEENGLELVQSNYSDLGVSAYKSVHRSGLQNMFDAITSGAIPRGSVVVIEAVDRLSRKQYQETNDLVQQIVNGGVSLYVAADNMLYDSTTVNDIDKIMMLAIRCQIAFEESEQKSIRVKAAKDKKKMQALDGIKTKKSLPSWLVFDQNTNEFVFNEHVKCIKKIISLKQNSGTESSITNELNRLGFKPPRSDKWNPTSIRKILSNHALYGAWLTRINKDGVWCDDEIILNHYPSLVSYEEWVLLTPKKRLKGKYSKDNHFTKLTRCAACNSVMTKKKAVVGGKIYIQYRCVSAAKNLGCKSPPINSDRLEDLIYKYSRFLKQSKSNNNDLLKQELNSKEVAYLQITEALKTNPSVMALITSSISLDAEIKQLKQKIKEMGSETEMYRLSELWNDPVQWNNNATRFIDTIYVEIQGLPRKNKLLQVTIIQTNGHVIQSRFFGGNAIEARSYDWKTVDELKHRIG